MLETAIKIEPPATYVGGASRIFSFRAATSLLAIAITFNVGTGVHAETTIYGYDALGRLTSSSISGGPANGVVTAIDYDKADNRSSYTVIGVPTQPPSVPIVASFSFEEPEQGNAPGSYQYNPPVSGAIFAGKSGVAANGSDWGFPSAPDGDQVAFLQTYTDGGATITLNVSALTPGQNYAVSYRAALRGGWAASPVTVSAQGSTLGVFTPPSTSFNQVTSGSFTAAASTTQVSFSAPASSEYTHAGIDNVTIVPATAPPSVSPGAIANNSFEQPAVGADFQYNPGVADQYYGGNAGVAGNGSAFGFNAAPAGTQVAFLQGDNAVVATNVSGLTVGATYVVRFSLGKRVYQPANSVYVSFQNMNLGVHAPAGQPFQQFTTAQFVANATTGVLVFSGQTAGDSGTGIDAISISGP